MGRTSRNPGGAGGLGVAMETGLEKFDQNKRRQEGPNEQGA